MAESSSSPMPFPIKTTSYGQEDLRPSLPPHMASVRSYNADEVVKMMSKTPLFMTSLDDVDEDDGENVELAALRALQYEGTAFENALGFKERGNEMVKSKRWKDGKEFYTKALEVLHGRTRRTSKEEDYGVEEEEVHKEKGIEEACYVNRALCNLELKNYRSTTLDCAATLRLNSSNVKALYRSSQALLALDKISEALDCCTRGQVLQPENSAFRSLSSRIESRASKIAAVETTRSKAAARVAKEKEVLSAALRARQILIRTDASPPSLEDAVIHLSPDPLSPSSTVVFPLLLLYPLNAQSDFIKSFPENDTLSDHLEYIFPLPWDSEHRYRVGNVECYMETMKEGGGLIKIGKKMSLLEVIGGGKAVLLDGIVKVNVLPKDAAGDWIQGMRKRKGK